MNGLVTKMSIAIVGLVILTAFQNCQQVDSFEPNSINRSNKFYGTATGNPPSEVDDEKLSFEVVSAEVFEPHCVLCHGEKNNEEGIRYDSYKQALRGDLWKLKRAYSHYREPDDDCAKISVEQMDLVVRWITEGASK